MHKLSFAHRVLLAAFIGAAVPACDKAEEPAASKAATDAAPSASTPPPAKQKADAGYYLGEQLPFSADYQSHGVMLKTGPLTGHLRVGVTGARLDLPEHPNAGHPISLLQARGELWKIDTTNQTFARLGTGDWETKLFPRLVSTRNLQRIAEGRCPFGSAKPEACAVQGNENFAGRAAEHWKYKKREIWLDAQLRVALREIFKPLWKKDDLQTIELSNVREGAQDPAAFLVPAGLNCNSGNFCDSAPIAR